MAKSYLPKVGDKFYFIDAYGELQERICVDILKGEKEFQTLYYTQKNKHGGLFVTESAILNPNSKRVQKLLAAKEKKAWREFWTKERIDEFMNIPYYVDVLDYIKSKIE